VHPWKKLAVFAADCLRKWDKPMIPWTELFAVQFDPMWVEAMRSSFACHLKTIIDSILISADHNLVLPDDQFSRIIIRGKGNYKELEPLTHSLQSMLICAIRISSYLRMRSVRDTVKDVVSSCFNCMGWHEIPWGNARLDDSEQKTLSIRCPIFYPVKEASYAEVVSFNLVEIA